MSWQLQWRHIMRNRKWKKICSHWACLCTMPSWQLTFSLFAEASVLNWTEKSTHLILPLQLDSYNLIKGTSKYLSYFYLSIFFFIQISIVNIFYMEKKINWNFLKYHWRCAVAYALLMNFQIAVKKSNYSVQGDDFQLIWASCTFGLFASIEFELFAKWIRQ